MTFTVTVDLVVLTIRDAALSVLLIRRAIPPFAGAYALPGGFVLEHEDLMDAAVRELSEETGVDGIGHLEQLGTYGSPTRDPRGRVVTVAYLAFLPDAPAPQAGSDAATAEWLPFASLPPLAFDHGAILADGVERARAKLEYSPLATAFCPPEFTIADLREVYEAVWATPLDLRNFHRKVSKTPGFVIPTGAVTAGERGRPARLFTRGPAQYLVPPMLRINPDDPDESAALVPRTRKSRPAETVS